QKAAARLKANVVNLKTAAVVFRFLALLSPGPLARPICTRSLHPSQATFSAEAKTGDGSRLSHRQDRLARRQLTRVYSLTSQAGQITAGKPKSVDERCPNTLKVSLSSKPKMA